MAFLRNGELEAVKLPGRKQSVYRRDQVHKLEKELKEFTPPKTEKPTRFMRAAKEDLPMITEISNALFGTGRSVTPLERRIAWREKNPDIYYILKQGDQIVGYANILPLKTGTDKIKRLLGDITTVDITPDDIVEFRPGMHTDLYVMPIGVSQTTI